MATAATQVRNVLTRLIVNRDDVWRVEGIITRSGTAQLHKYSSVDLTPQELYIGVVNQMDSNNTIMFREYSGSYPENVRLLDVYFNVPSSETAPLNTVSFHYGENLVYGDDATPNSLRYIEVLMGDVDQDGDIDAVDYQKVLKASMNTLNPPLTEAQELASDVNRDNRIDAKDALKISQYTVFKINSFWDDAQLVLPTEHTDKIVHQGWYRIKNAQTGQYIMGGNTEATKYQATVGATTNNKAACLKFKINQAANNNAPAGSFSLRCLSYPNDTLYLKLDSDYELTLAYGEGEYLTYSGHWFLLPQSDGTFRMVNRAAPKRALTDFGYAGATNPKCEAGYCEPGSDWILEPVLTIAYYYDQAYKSRNSSAQSFLTQRQAEIATILKYVFGISPVIEEPGSTPVQSFSDECSANINSLCSCSGRTTSNCKAYHGTGTLSKLHHNNATGLLDDLIQNSYVCQPGKVNLMSSGHCPCYVSGGVHGFKNIAGLANTEEFVAVIYQTGESGNEYRDYLTALHEISHCLGAVGGTVDQEHNNKKCVMSDGGTRNNKYLLDEWKKPNASGYTNLFCSTCKDKIAVYLKTV